MRVALLVNPQAGRGRAGAVASEAARILGRTATVDLIETGHAAADFLTAASRAVADRPDAIIVCGGDGSVHLAANALVGGDIPLGIVPAGSGNDIADMLGFSPDPAAAAAQLAAAIAASSTARIDIGRCDGPQLIPGCDRAFVGLLYAGFDAAVNARANRIRRIPARARYNAALAIETLRLRARPMIATLDGRPISTPATLIAVGNGAQYGGGKRIAPGASWYDGLFEVAVIGKVSRTTLARLAPTLPRGGHVGHPAASFDAAREVVLEAPEAPEVECYADGEPVGRLPVRAWVEPAALPVLVPVEHGSGSMGE